MKESLDALRGYVHFLHEREGVRQIRLSKSAQAGLARLAAAIQALPATPNAPVPSSSSERRAAPPATFTGGSSATTTRPAPAQSRPASTPTATRPARPASTPVAPSMPVAASEGPAIEISGSSKAEQLRHLAERAAACVKCPHLVARRHNVVFGVGDPEAKLMFVGEGPGEDEDLKGEPFVGKAGQLLTKMIVAMGLTREQVYIGNVLKCRPDMPPGSSGNRKPTKEEMATCVPYLRAQIEVIKPAVLVGLGATAMEGLTGSVASMSSLRGKFMDYRGIPLMPTYHPAYLLRNQSNTEKRKVWEDLLKVMERLEMPISEKQRGFFLAK